MEPYSLVFKRRKSDNVGHEYFYAYDQTGGNSGPGIKTMFAHAIEHLEVTDIDFEPRFEIQLAKAGDSAIASYFTGTPGRRGPRLAGPRADGAKYIVECNTCGKPFRRKKRSTRMNKHKEPSGGQCYGRSGTIVAYL